VAVNLRFQGHGVIIDALDILCAQVTRDLFAIAKFLLYSGTGEDDSDRREFLHDGTTIIRTGLLSFWRRYL